MEASNGTVQFKYDRLPGLGGGLGSDAAVPPASNSSWATGLLSSLGITGTTPVTAAERSVDDVGERQQAPATGKSLGDTLDDDFISFGDSAGSGGAAAVDVADASLDASARAQAGASTSSQSTLPWSVASRRIRSPLLRLHNEVAEFCRFLEPTEAEAAERTAAVDRITQIIIAIFPSASVQLFGSVVTGLYLPTSDLDLVVVDSGCTNIPQALKALATSLTRQNLAREVQVIAKAKVPIIKFEEVASGLNFDVSFDVANGPQAAEYVRQVMQAYPPMKPLVLVLKVFLQQRELNEVYSGGIGSYALLVMVAAFLMTHPSRRSDADGHPGELEQSLGVLLVDFARLYGRALNMTDVGVSCRSGGRFFSKRAAQLYQSERPYLLSVQDPQDATNDLCKGSYAISKVRQALEYAYMQLTAPADSDESLLRRVIRLDAVLTERPRLVSWKNLRPLHEALPRSVSAPPSPDADDVEAAAANGSMHAHKRHKHKHKHRHEHKHRHRHEEREADADEDDYPRSRRHGSKRRSDSQQYEPTTDAGYRPEGSSRSKRRREEREQYSNGYNDTAADEAQGQRRRRGEREAAFGDYGEEAAVKQRHIRFN